MNEERNQAIQERRAKGATYRQIAREFQLSDTMVKHIAEEPNRRAMKWARRRKLFFSERISSEKRELVLSDGALEEHKQVDGFIQTHLTIDDHGFGKHPPSSIDELADRMKTQKFYSIGKRSACRIRELTEENPSEPVKPIKEPVWALKEHSKCEQLRALVGAQFGDGLAYLKQLKQGGKVQRELAATWERAAREAFWSIEQFDAMISVYSSNPLMKLLLSSAESGSPFQKFVG